jgi:ADP-L-glycero-D-manno-heptose 6-epimerase
MADHPTYIVTGGAGFIGANLCARLKAREPGAHIVIVDDFRSGSWATIVEAFDYTGAEPFDGQVLAQHAGSTFLLVEELQPAAVFHLAAITDTTVRDEAQMIQDNVDGFEELIEACHHICPLVYASSAATYGSPPQGAERVPFPEEAAGRPNNVYGFSKWLMECVHRRAVARMAGQGGRPLPVVGLRFFNVFGPGEAAKGGMASMPYQLARQMLAGQRPRIFEDGRQARDQVSVDDVVDCMLAAAGMGARKDPEPGIYNLGSGRATTFDEIVESLREALGYTEEQRPTEYFPMPPHIAEHYQDYTCADMSRAAAGLGWKPSRDPRQAIMDYGRYLMKQHGERHGRDMAEASAR